MEEIILFILEMLGTVAFAVSGAFVAIRKKFDIFGVLVIGALTAVGGGITRDILIGATPPAVFSRFYVVGVAALTALTVFVLAYGTRKNFRAIQEKIEQVNNVFDAIGLAAFTVAGTEIAFNSGLNNNVFLSVTLGVLTGVGGGVLRDVLTETPPYIFKKHVYALASIVGACLYYGLRWWTGQTLLATVAAILFIIGVRLLATKYRWDLPKVELEGQNEE